MTGPEQEISREQQQFTDSLKIIEQKLAAHQVDYSLVGGLAIKAILGEKVEPHRSNGTLIDLDAVALGPNATAIESALSELAQQGKNQPVFPELGIEPVIFSDSPPRFSFLTLLSSLRADADGRYFLNYRQVEEEVPPETMELQKVLVNGVPFSCFPAKTILFRYLVRGGILKEKDDEKLVGLENYLLDHWDEQPDDQLYAPYLRFAERIRETYPGAIGLYSAYWKLDRLLGGQISGGSGPIYDLIKNFRAGN